MNHKKPLKNAQTAELIPFSAFPTPIDDLSYAACIEQLKHCYTAWSTRASVCETNSHIALSEREFDYWHDLFLEADIEAAYYFAALKAAGGIPNEN